MPETPVTQKRTSSKFRWLGVAIVAVGCFSAFLAIATKSEDDPLAFLAEIPHREFLRLDGKLSNGMKLAGRWKVLEFYEDPIGSSGGLIVNGTVVPTKDDLHSPKQAAIRSGMDRRFGLPTRELSDDRSTGSFMLETRTYTDPDGAKIVVEITALASQPTSVWIPQEDWWAKFKRRMANAFSG